MKTPAIVEGVRPLWRLEKGTKDRYDDALKAWKAGELVTEEHKKVVSGEIREALRAKLTEKAQKLAADLMASTISQPVRGWYIVNDSTVEKLGELLNENPNGLLVFRDELTGLLRTLNREDHASARAFYLEAWNGTKRFTYDRIGRGTIDIEAACLSILGCIQSGPLSHYLRAVLEGGLGDDGLIQRFQLLVWPDVAAEWNNVDRWPDRDAKQTAYKVFARLSTLNPADIKATCAEDEQIPCLNFGADAQELFTEWRSELEHGLRRAGGA